MTTLDNVTAWDGVQDGTLAPFIEIAVRDQLILDRTVVQVISIKKEKTIHGTKMFVEIAVPPDHERFVCSFSTGPTNHPRMKTFAALASWLTAHKGMTLPAVLVQTGPAYMIIDPRTVN